MDFGPLRAEPDPGADGVLEVVIDHPPTNLVDGAFVVGLSALLDSLATDGTARVVVFSSADPDFFLMHGDVHGILAIPTGPRTPATAPNVAAALFERLHRSPFVTIGLLDGAARGGGAEFLAALDLRFGSEHARPRSARGPRWASSPVPAGRRVSRTCSVAAAPSR